MRSLPVLVIAAVAAAVAPSAHGATALLDTKLSSSDAYMRSCTSLAPAGAPGVAITRARSADTGFLRLTTAGSGDWDVAVFDRASRRFVAGSAQPGAGELAQGFVASGQELVVQACRFRGDAGSVRVQADTTPLQSLRGADKVQVVAVHTPTRADKDRLGTLGLDPAEGASKTTIDVVLHDAADVAKLRAAGFAWTVRIADLVALDRRNARASRASSRGATAAAAAVPSGRADYRHLADYETEMKMLATKNPGLVKLITLPHKSLEGRAIIGIEIAKDVNVDNGKPVFMQLGVHHAREWPAGEAPMEWAYELINGYGKAPRVTKIVDNSRNIVVPIVNPDGFNLSREAAGGTSADPGTPAGEANPPPEVNEQLPITDPLYTAAIVGDQTAGTYSYKRRNCRIVDGKAPAEGECGAQENRALGVDPNRNYGGLWGGPGASTDPEVDTYRGASPFSEPETQNIRELVLANQVTTLITNHTFTGLVLRPPGVRSQGVSVDEGILKALGDAMAGQTGYTSQPGYALYDTTGTTEDWSYGATGGLGYTFEIGKKQFHPPYAEVIGEYEGAGDFAGKGLRGAYFLAAENAVDKTKHSILSGNAPAGTVLRITKTFSTLTSPVIDKDGKVGPEQTFEDTVNDSITVGAGGSFEWHMNPSTRPGVAKGRTVSEPEKTPASKQDASSATPIPPKQPKLVEITVPAGTRLVRAFTTGTVPADDYDIYLYEGSVAKENQVASSAGGTADENLTYDYPKAGKYILEIVNFAAAGPIDGTVELYNAQAGTEKVIAPAKESYTLTCETATGQVLTTNSLQLDRGEAKTLNPCSVSSGPGSSAPVAGSGVKGTATKLGFKLRVQKRKLRRALKLGLVARAQCSVGCRALAVATIPRKTARRLGLTKKKGKGQFIVARGAMSKTKKSVKRATFKLKFTKQARKRLRRVKRVQLRVLGVASTTEGLRTKRRLRILLKR